MQGALPLSRLILLGAVSRARADISCERIVVGEEGSMILDTLVVPEYNTRDAVMSNTKIMFSPDTGAASRAEIFLTAPNIILSGLSLAASILTICKPGLRPVLIKQII